MPTGKNDAQGLQDYALGKKKRRLEGRRLRTFCMAGVTGVVMTTSHGRVRDVMHSLAIECDVSGAYVD